MAPVMAVAFLLLTFINNGVGSIVAVTSRNAGLSETSV